MCKGVGTERGNISHSKKKQKKKHKHLNMAIPTRDVIADIFKHPNFRNF